jgi:hypothetical protein
MAEFFCFTCVRHKPEDQRAPSATPSRSICKSCDLIRARNKAKPRKASSANQIRAGQRVLFTHLRRLGEI